MIEEALRIIGGTLDTSNPQADDRAKAIIVRIGLSDDFEMASGVQIMELAKHAMSNVRIVFRQTNSLIAA